MYDWLYLYNYCYIILLILFVRINTFGETKNNLMDNEYEIISPHRQTPFPWHMRVDLYMGLMIWAHSSRDSHEGGMSLLSANNFLR